MDYIMKIRVLLLLFVFTITTLLFPYRGILINEVQAASVVIDSGSQTYKTTTHKIEHYGFSTGFKQKIYDGSKDYMIRLHYRLPSGAPVSGNRIYAQLGSTIVFDTKVVGTYNGYVDIQIPDTNTDKTYDAISMMVDLNGSAKTGDSELKYEVFYEDITAPTKPVINGVPSTWTTSALINIDGSSDASGITRYMYRIDNKEYIEYKNPFLAPDGQHTIETYAVDMNGLQSEHVTVTSFVDNTPPTSPILNGGGDQWYSNNVNIDIRSGTDSQSGINRTEYYLSGATSTSWQNGNGATIFNEGITIIHARTIDNVGNISQEVERTIKIDRIQPDLTITEQKIDSSTLRLTAKATDASSGIKSITLPNGSIVNSDTATFDTKINGTYTFIATDQMGLTTTQTKNISNLDETPPTINITYSKSYAKSITIQISAEDNDTGVKEIVLPDGSIIRSNQAETIIKENGTYLFKAIDIAGNVTEQNIIISTIDTQQPTMDIFYSDVPQQELTFKITTSDKESGIDFITLPDGTRVHNTDAEYTVHTNGQYTFKVTDKAGNDHLQSIEVQHIDQVKPEIQVDVNGSTWTDQPITILISYQDLDSGLDKNKLYYKLTQTENNPENWNIAEKDQQPLVITEEGEWYLHAMAVDQAGNKQVFTSKKYQLQRQPEIPNLKVKGISSEEIQLNWELSNGASITDGYTYYIRNQETGKTFQVEYPENSIIDKDLKGGEIYHYTIQVQNHVGSSEKSKSISGYTLPEAPTHVLVERLERDYEKALLTISPVQSASAYQIQAINVNNQQVDVDTTVTGNVYQQISGLKPYTFYTIVVTAINPSGNGLPYHVSYLSLPSAPTGFRFLQMTENSILLDWNTVAKSTYTTSSVQEDTYYSLKRSETYIYQGPYQRFIDSGLSSGSAFNYAIAAGNTTGWSNFSYLSNIWTLPSVVGRLEQVDAHSHSVALNWQAVRGATGYRIVIENVGEYNASDDLTSFEVKGLEPGFTYRATITPYNKSGYGSSKEILINTLPESMFNESVIIKDITESNAVIEIEPIEGATKYRLEIDGKEYIIPEGDFQIPSLAGSTYYNYSITSGNSAGWTQPLIGTLLTSPSAPSDVKLTDVTDQSLSFHWNQLANVDTYTIYDENKKEIKTTAEEQAVITNLNAGEIYNFYISATNQNGTSSLNKFTYRTLPESTIRDTNQVRISNITVDSVDLEWNIVKGADQYQLYDNTDHLVYETAQNTAHLDKLSSATSYEGWYIVPLNTAGKGKNLDILSFETLPSNQFKIIDSDATRSTVTLKIEHFLVKEQLVIELNNKIVFRGLTDTFTQDTLKADQSYVFKIWSENSKKQASTPISITIRTKKEKEKNTKIIESENEKKLQQTDPLDEIVTVPEKNDYLAINNDQEFEDIDSIFSKSQIQELHQMGIIEGVSRTNFEPEREVTRAEFMALIVRGQKYINKETSSINTTKKIVFDDIDWSAWYIPELKDAIYYNYVKGFSKKVFAPTLTVNREQASKMIVNAVIGNIEDSIDVDQFEFSDAAYISKWATGSIQKGYQKGIILGYPNHSFQPKNNLTRAEAAMLLYRMIANR